MLVETDAYLAPVPYRGRSRPGYTRYVVETITPRTLGLAWEEVAHQTTQNAIKLFTYGRRNIMNPVIVVEGRDTRQRGNLSGYRNGETNGSAIDEEQSLTSRRCKHAK